METKKSISKSPKMEKDLKLEKAENSSSETIFSSSDLQDIWEELTINVLSF
jgi:hypothetical protein